MLWRSVNAREQKDERRESSAQKLQLCEVADFRGNCSELVFVEVQISERSNAADGSGKILELVRFEGKNLKVGEASNRIGQSTNPVVCQVSGVQAGEKTREKDGGVEKKKTPRTAL